MNEWNLMNVAYLSVINVRVIMCFLKLNPFKLIGVYIDGDI